MIQLQQKVDMYQHENDALIQSVTQLREQLMTLKSILLAHKDCPVAMQQGFSAQNLMLLLQQDPAVGPFGTGPVNGVSQGMPMSMPDARSSAQVLPRA
jgi:ATF/CREB family transcription factor